MRENKTEAYGFAINSYRNFLYKSAVNVAVICVYLGTKSQVCIIF